MPSCKCYDGGRYTAPGRGPGDDEGDGQPKGAGAQRQFTVTTAATSTLTTRAEQVLGYSSARAGVE